ncbi:unnamed protein product [Brassica oleracea]
MDHLVCLTILLITMIFIYTLLLAVCFPCIINSTGTSRKGSKGVVVIDYMRLFSVIFAHSCNFFLQDFVSDWKRCWHRKPSRCSCRSCVSHWS